MNWTVGTPNFSSYANAVLYYRKQGIYSGEVEKKLHSKEIFIGRPELKEGETCAIDTDGRYVIRRST